MTSYLDPSAYQESQDAVSHRFKSIGIMLGLLVGCCLVFIVGGLAWNQFSEMRENRMKLRVLPGMTSSQVESILGQPSETVKVPLPDQYLPCSANLLPPTKEIELRKISYCMVYCFSYTSDLIVFYDSSHLVLGSAHGTSIRFRIDQMWK